MVVVVPFRLLFTSKYLVSQALCLVKKISLKNWKKIENISFSNSEKLCNSAIENFGQRKSRHEACSFQKMT